MIYERDLLYATDQNSLNIPIISEFMTNLKRRPRIIILWILLSEVLSSGAKFKLLQAMVGIHELKI